MAVTYKYWEDCVHKLDMEALWMDPQVRTEWIDAGETKGQKVHISRDPDGEPFLTQNEYKAIIKIVARRHFHSLVDMEMMCALAELQSDRRILATRYNKKTKETTIGLLQISTQIATWLFKEHGYRAYDVEEQPNLLYQPLVNVYLGIAYVKCLFNFEQRERNEEFVVRAFSGGVKKATHKSTLPYWKHYVSVKSNLPSSNKFIDESPTTDQIASDETEAASASSDEGHISWDSRTSVEDMNEMWGHRDIHKQWIKSREIRGNVRFSKDTHGFYLTRKELKAVAEIIVSKHFSSQVIKLEMLCAIAEVISARYLNGKGSRIGLMGIDYPTAKWLYKELDYNAYAVESIDDLRKPFVSMYFGAAYMTWLSKYDGRERSPHFMAKAYVVGPKNVNLEETHPEYLKFEQELSYYGQAKSESQSCIIM